MALNKYEFILDKVRSVVLKDPDNEKIKVRLTQIEDSSLNCTAEGEEVTDAFGAPITTLYRAKRANYSGTASLINLALAAEQFGDSVKIAGSGENAITDYAYEILTIKRSGTEGNYTYSVDALKETPDADGVPYIYAIEDNELGTAYEVGTTASETKFSISGKQITLPTGLTEGKIYVEYSYQSTNAVKVSNYAEKFPEMCIAIIYAYFRDKCNENTVYSGKIIGEHAKVNPESIDLGLTSTGKHPFQIDFNRNYCEEDGELFSIIVSAPTPTV